MISPLTVNYPVFSQCSRWWSCCCISVCYWDFMWCHSTSPLPASWTQPPSNNAPMLSATRGPPWSVTWLLIIQSDDGGQQIVFTLPCTLSYETVALRRVTLPQLCWWQWATLYMEPLTFTLMGWRRQRNCASVLEMHSLCFLFICLLLHIPGLF